MDEIDNLVSEVLGPGEDISEMALSKLRPLLQELVDRRKADKKVVMGSWAKYIVRTMRNRHCSVKTIARTIGYTVKEVYDYIKELKQEENHRP